MNHFFMSLPPQYYFACLSLLCIVDMLSLVTVDENHIAEKSCSTWTAQNHCAVEPVGSSGSEMRASPHLFALPLY